MLNRLVIMLAMKSSENISTVTYLNSNISKLIQTSLLATDVLILIYFNLKTVFKNRN